jgi:hypothetical protein
MLWITILFALLIALFAYVIWPLVRQDAPLLPLEDDRLTDLLTRKDTALRALKDLEFDHQVGKINDEDYQRFHERLSRQAVGLLQQIERITPESAQLDEQMEAEIAKLRRVEASPRTVVTATAVPTPIGGNGVAATAGAVRFCTECGTPLTPSFKFCANCGTPIARVVAGAEN